MSWFTPGQEPDAVVSASGSPEASSQAEPAPATVEEAPSPTPSAPPAAKTPEAKYRFRRMAAAAAALTTVGLVAFLVVPQLRTEQPSQVPASEQMLALDMPIEDLAHLDQVKALKRFESTGSFKGFQPAKGGTVYWAHYGNTVVFSRDYAGSCVYYAVSDGSASDIQADPTGQACSKKAVNQVKQSLKSISN